MSTVTNDMIAAAMQVLWSMDARSIGYADVRAALEAAEEQR